MDLVKQIVDLYKKTSTLIPEDVDNYLKKSLSDEKLGSVASETLKTIQKNIELAKAENKPICQDTGTPIFFVKKGQKIRY